MHINRRDLAKTLGLAGASYFLPNLRAANAASPIPKRFIIFYTQHGTLPWRWRPKGTGTNFTLGPLLSNLEPYKKDLILLDGIDFAALNGNTNFGCGHVRGQASSLTAQNQIDFNQGDGISIDYFIANGLKAANNGMNPTLVPQQQARILQRQPNVLAWGAPYHPAPRQPTAPEPNPTVVLERLFPGGKVPGTMAAGMSTGSDKSAQKRSATLDFLKNEFKVVEAKLGKAEKVRLEQHATLVSDLRANIDKMGTGTGAVGMGNCAVPQGIKSNAGALDFGAKWWANTVDAMPKLAVAALACDVTRVFALSLEDPPGAPYGFDDGGDSVHVKLHDLQNGNKDNQGAGLLSMANGFYGAFAKEFKNLLDKLSDIKESDGNSLLYHTCVLWCGELADSSHTTVNAKWLCAGQLGGFLKTGQVIATPGVDLDAVSFNRSGTPVPSNGDVFTTIAQGMGVKNPSFGKNNLYGGNGIAAMKA